MEGLDIPDSPTLSHPTLSRPIGPVRRSPSKSRMLNTLTDRFIEAERKKGGAVEMGDRKIPPPVAKKPNSPFSTPKKGGNSSNSPLSAQTKIDNTSVKSIKNELEDLFSKKPPQSLNGKNDSESDFENDILHSMDNKKRTSVENSEMFDLPSGFEDDDITDMIGSSDEEDDSKFFNDLDLILPPPPIGNSLPSQPIGKNPLSASATKNAVDRQNSATDVMNIEKSKVSISF